MPNGLVHTETYASHCTEFYMYTFHYCKRLTCADLLQIKHPCI